MSAGEGTLLPSNAPSRLSTNHAVHWLPPSWGHCNQTQSGLSAHPLVVTEDVTAPPTPPSVNPKEGNGGPETRMDTPPTSQQAVSSLVNLAGRVLGTSPTFPTPRS